MVDVIRKWNGEVFSLDILFAHLQAGPLSHNALTPWKFPGNLGYPRGPHSRALGGTPCRSAALRRRYLLAALLDFLFCFLLQGCIKLSDLRFGVIERA